MIVYKVFRREEDKLKSLVVDNYFTLEYVPKEWILPKIGKIFIFQDLQRAIEYKNHHINKNISAEVWECEVPDNPVYIGFVAEFEEDFLCSGESHLPSYRVLSFWCPVTKKMTNKQRAPYGSFVSSKIKLLRPYCVFHETFHDGECSAEVYAKEFYKSVLELKL